MWRTRRTARHKLNSLFWTGASTVPSPAAGRLEIGPSGARRQSTAGGRARTKSDAARAFLQCPVVFAHPDSTDLSPARCKAFSRSCLGGLHGHCGWLGTRDAPPLIPAPQPSLGGCADSPTESPGAGKEAGTDSATAADKIGATCFLTMVRVDVEDDPSRPAPYLPSARETRSRTAPPRAETVVRRSRRGVFWDTHQTVQQH
jgi:hypothetical protein